LRLWTWQEADFNIVSQPRELSKSRYTETVPAYSSVRQDLASRLSCSPEQVLFCFQDHEEGMVTFGTDNKLVQWELDVPERFAKPYDYVAWHKLLGCTPFNILRTGSRLEQAWKEEAGRKGLRPGQDEWFSFLKGKERAIFEDEPEEQLWSRLFDIDASDPFSQILVVGQLRQEWVVSYPR